MKPSTILACALAAASLGACVDRSHGGYFDAEAFYSTRQHFRVRYLARMRETRALLGPEWHPENIVFRDGRPVELMRPRWPQWVPIDVDGDGRNDTRTALEGADLRFEHRRDGATMVVSTIPISGALAERSLEVLMHEMLEAAADTRRGPAGIQVIQSLYEGPARVGGAEAFQAVFEGASLGSEGQVVATTTDRAFLVVVRPHTRFVVGAQAVPMIVTFWLFARREHFDQHVPAFRSLLERTDFRMEGTP